MKWHIKLKYLVQKFHDICLSYYFKLKKIQKVIGKSFTPKCQLKWDTFYEKQLSENKFGIYWTRLNVSKTLKFRSKADFKSKSQNIWQQIILFSRTVMQMICAWPKIWTLSGRLSLMWLWRLINFRLFCSDDCRSWPRDEKINNYGWWGKHAHIPDNVYWEICLFHVVGVIDLPITLWVFFSLK
jgi:hypothetical protein